MAIPDVRVIEGHFLLRLANLRSSMRKLAQGIESQRDG